jgi:hypothetical protein
MDIPYIPGKGSIPDLPLGRFIPPIPSGMVSQWCQKYLSPRDRVLDPFGFNPMVPVEIASAGFQVLTTVNNPIHAFMLKIIATAPQESELIASLQDLAVAPKGDERMEPYIRSLYHVRCANCKRRIEADSFLWEKGADYPFQAQVECPFCGAAGEQEVTSEDKEIMGTLPSIQLHQARALNRIVGNDEKLRSQVLNALNAYPPRPIIILQTIINKLNSLDQSARRRDLLIALILSAADLGNTLWAYPSPRNRPRQIVVPNVYQERNLWKVLEESIKSWQVLSTPIPLQNWGESYSEDPGIFLFPGRIRELTPQPDQGFFSAIFAAIPRPNQAFWTLSALWTGWIWGQEAITPIRNVLFRQRYDWNWHTNALKAVFDTFKDFYHPDLKLYGLIAENEPMLLLAALMAAETSGLTLSAFAHSLDDQIAQCHWHKNPNPRHHDLPASAIKIAHQSVRDYLNQKGEPASYQQIHTSAITGLASEHKLALDIFLQNPNNAASETQKWIESLFTEGDLLIRIGAETASIETTDWRLKNPSEQSTSLIDRVEQSLLKYLFEVQETTAQDLKTFVYQTFPGRFTPGDKALLNCLDSYAELINQKDHIWRLRENEKAELREAEVNKIRKILLDMGERLNYKSRGDNPILWLDDLDGKPDYSFHVLSTAIVSKLIWENNANTRKNVLVIPGSRANLLAYKKQRDPILGEILDHNFLTVKFRLIRDLDANALLTRDLFIEQIQIDPPEYRASQLALF